MSSARKGEAATSSLRLQRCVAFANHPHAHMPFMLAASGPWLLLEPWPTPWQQHGMLALTMCIAPSQLVCVLRTGVLARLGPPYEGHA